MNTVERIVITGIGVVSPLGNDPETLWKSLKDGKCAIKEHAYLKEEGFQIPKYALCDDNFGPSGVRGKNMAIYAAKQAAVNDTYEDKIVGVYIGTSMGESGVFEEISNNDNNLFDNGLSNKFAEVIKEKLNLNGPAYGYGAACAAGNYAIGTAADTLRAGLIDTAFAGGVEPFSKIALTGFVRSRAMAVNKCKPFDVEREGMQIGEGAAVLRLERESDALKRDTKIYAVVGELGLSCDAYHPTSPKKDGSGMARSINSALVQNNLQLSEIDWICAHGTGTRISDLTEATALKTVFGSSMPPVTGFKGALGHTMGAASAIEALLCVLSLEKQEILKTVGYENLDSEINIPIVTDNKQKEISKVINSAYGFGGVNSCLILEKK